jgi:hypothetical protein
VADALTWFAAAAVDGCGWRSKRAHVEVVPWPACSCVLALHPQAPAHSVCTHTCVFVCVFVCVCTRP